MFLNVIQKFVRNTVNVTDILLWKSKYREIKMKTDLYTDLYTY